MPVVGVWHACTTVALCPEDQLPALPGRVPSEGMQEIDNGFILDIVLPSYYKGWS